MLTSGLILRCRGLREIKLALSMASPSDNPLTRLIREIHCRSLWQVLGIFLLGGWLAFEVVQTLTEGLGLPVVLATAFVQEGGPKATPSEPSGLIVGVPSVPSVDPSVPRRLFTWRNAIGGGVLAFALLGFVGTTWVLLGGGIGGAPGTAEAPTPIERSIAVLPFDDLSPEGDQQYFVEGLSEEIINALTQIVDLKVSARTSAFAFQGSNLDIRTIADSLGVANLLEGSVR